MNWSIQLNEKTWEKDVHKELVTIKKTSPDVDKVQFFTEDDVIWKDIAKVLDAIKVRQPGDPMFTMKAKAPGEKAMAEEYLFPKVVMASVML